MDNLKKYLNIIFVSDIHLGHHSTPTEDILKNLRREFSYENLKGVDAFIIGGDIFDRLLNLPDDRVSQIKEWAYDILKICKTLNIVFRILHGTPSHDFRQAIIFEQINQFAKIGCNFRFVTDLEIEFIEQLGINVLYVPDEWRGDPRQTQKEVISLLEEKKIKQVDVSVMHGFFEYQIPDKAQAHSDVFYESITIHVISIGHVHHFSTKGKITAQGSFDRLSQGYESPKGYVKVSLNLNDPTDIKKEFCVNKYATWYKTVNITECLYKEEAKEAIDKILSSWYSLYPTVVDRPLLFIRIIYNDTQNFNDLFLSYTKNIKQSISWNFVKEEKEEKLENVLDVSFEPVPINPNTILDIYSKALESRNDLDENFKFNTLEIVKMTKDRIFK